MAITDLQNKTLQPTFQDFVNQALRYDVGRLEAIIRGQERSFIPVLAAMTAYQQKLPQATAARGQQAQQQLQQAQPTVRQEMAQSMIPDMRMLQQQQAGPQPPVLPEQTGVGALPAPNMETMGKAGGGIIAFKDGEDVVDPFINYARNPLRTDAMRQAEEQRLEEERLLEEQRQQRAQQRAREREKATEEKKRLEKASEERRAARKRGEKPETGPVDLRPDESAAETARLQRQAQDTTPIAEKPETKAAAATDKKPAPAPKTSSVVPPPKAATTPPTGIEAALTAAERLGGAQEADYKAKLANYGAEVTAGLDALARKYEQGKPTGEAYSKYEQSLQKEEEGAKGKEERNLRMALVNAGFAMMAGTSPYAFENIGKGAMLGSKQYMEGVDKLEAAAKKRQEAFALIEQARRAEARDDWKERNRLEAEKTKAELDAKKYAIDGFGKVFEVNKKTATDIYNTEATNRRAVQVAEIGAGAQRYAADKYSSARGGSPQNIAVDNAKARLDSWLKSAEGKVASLKPGAVDRKYQEYLRDAYAEMGLPMPAGSAAGATPRSNLPPLSPQTTPDLFK